MHWTTECDRDPGSRGTQKRKFPNYFGGIFYFVPFLYYISSLNKVLLLPPLTLPLPRPVSLPLPIHYHCHFHCHYIFNTFTSTLIFRTTITTRTMQSLVQQIPIQRSVFEIDKVCLFVLDYLLQKLIPLCNV